MKQTLFSLTLLSLLVGCGGGSSSTTTEKIDYANYFPKSDMVKNFIGIQRSGTNFMDINNTYFTENITATTANGITTITTKDGEVVKDTTVIDEHKINRTKIVDNEKTTNTMNRQVSKGDTLFVENINSSSEEAIGTITNTGTFKCVLEDTLLDFQEGDHKYTGDILKIKCIFDGKKITNIKEELLEYLADSNGSSIVYDVSYRYMKKEVGMIATIDNNCIENKLVNDKKDCIPTEKNYQFYLGN